VKMLVTYLFSYLDILKMSELFGGVILDFLLPQDEPSPSNWLSLSEE
jgi:hypothetical protein